MCPFFSVCSRAKQSAPSGGNGRRVISVDRPLRLRTAPRERPGCSPASLPPEGTSWPFSRCIGPDGPPVGGVQQLRLPWFSRKMYVYLRVSGVSLPSLRGGLGWWRPPRERETPCRSIFLRQPSPLPHVWYGHSNIEENHWREAQSGGKRKRGEQGGGRRAARRRPGLGVPERVRCRR